MSATEPTKPREPSPSPWSFRIARVAGIPLRVHFTFLLFLVWVAMASRQYPGSIWPALVVAIFFCVLLHEFGHALTARRFGVPTRDITLYPIGGVAMLQKRPNPREELWITAAGPLVNVVIAAVCGAVLLSSGQGLPPIGLTLTTGGFLENLYRANIALALFNLIPAFPMDGGRILRAALALRMGEARATQVAASVGQALAITFGFVALFSWNILFMIVAFFVFIGAGQEAAVTTTRSLMTGHRVRDAMQTRFRTILSGASLNEAAQMLLAGSQQSFPVVAGEDVIGVLTRKAIAEGIAAHGPDAYVAGHMARDFQTAVPDLPLERMMDLFVPEDSAPILVMDEGRLIGMLTRENLSEFLMLEEARSRARSYGYTA